ncbi:hypothetical protein NW765_017634 [Fusarium oxysporum]|nr:hypothetical protein NW765_017634 [Fusarium oxysporum]
MLKLPMFVRPLPPGFSLDEISYLLHKRSLHLPSNTLERVLLRAFVEHVYPQMPFVNLVTLLSIVHNRTGRDGRISLLVYQAIMFSGCAFGDLDHLQREGHSTRRAAQACFFESTVAILLGL